MTVSRVMNDDHTVHPSRRKRVLAAAAEIGYQQNDAARMLKGPRSKTIGLIVPDLSDSFFATCAHTIQQVARAKGHMTLVASSECDPEREIQQATLMASRKIAGLLIVTSVTSDNPIRSLQNDGLPIVAFDCPLDGIDTDAVVVENKLGAEEAVVSKEFSEKGYLLGKSSTPYVDLFNPDAAALYWKNFSARMLSLGIDAWWLDASENEDLDDQMTAVGPGKKVQMLYPLMESKTVYEGQRKDAPDKRVLILTRSAFLGQQRMLPPYGRAMSPTTGRRCGGKLPPVSITPLPECRIGHSMRVGFSGPERASIRTLPIMNAFCAGSSSPRSLHCNGCMDTRPARNRGTSATM